MGLVRRNGTKPRIHVEDRQPKSSTPRERMADRHPALLKIVIGATMLAIAAVGGGIAWVVKTTFANDAAASKVPRIEQRVRAVEDGVLEMQRDVSWIRKALEEGR